jgi:hypothetical protein
MMGEALVSQGADDAFQTARTGLGQTRVLESLGDGRQRHGVGELPVIDVPQHQLILDDSVFQTETVPCEQVHTAPLAALHVFPSQVTTNDIQILESYRLKGNHMKGINPW